MDPCQAKRDLSVEKSTLNVVRQAKPGGGESHVDGNLFAEPSRVWPCPAKAGDQPEPSVASSVGDYGGEAYIGSMWAAVIEPRNCILAKADALTLAEGCIDAS